MPKRKPREVTGFESELIALIDTASPDGTLFRTRPRDLREEPRQSVDRVKA